MFIFSPSNYLWLFVCSVSLRISYYLSYSKNEKMLRKRYEWMELLFAFLHAFFLFVFYFSAIPRAFFFLILKGAQYLFLFLFHSVSSVICVLVCASGSKHTHTHTLALLPKRYSCSPPSLSVSKMNGYSLMSPWDVCWLYDAGISIVFLSSKEHFHSLFCLFVIVYVCFELLWQDKLLFSKQKKIQKENNIKKDAHKQ